MLACTGTRKEACSLQKNLKTILCKHTNEHKMYTIFLCEHLCRFVCDGLGFRVNDGHLFCGYLGFLGCKRV